MAEPSDKAHAGMKQARFYEKDGDRLRCRLCPHLCAVGPGGTGLCGVRRNAGGVLYAESYGRFTSLALDPVEKKPLRRFHPGRRILSAGGYGCNMRCPYCQNSDISQQIPDDSQDGRTETEYIPPEKMLALALAIEGNLGVAFTYNEPLIAVEYLLDTAPLLKENGLASVLVTNGLVNPGPLEELLPYIDAMNIDIKGFTPAFYGKLGGDLETVKETVRLCAARCHVEVTTLVIPGENDGDGEMEALCGWLASVSPELPLHLSRFFPRWRMTEREPTPVNTLRRLEGIAKERLRHVYVGNV
ncbi:MAG: AmmeMemoRadiSam system radical SAM enzyme [Firmicutes bacterium]|nr:AmmeMemoRadiSam system radical SAM enzyme [Bacillota bacterium]